VADILDVLTLAEGKAAVAAANTGAYDGKLPGWITGVSRLLDRVVGPVVRRSMTAAVDGGYPEVFLPRHPNYSITSVTEYSGTTAQVLTAESNATQPTYAYRTIPYSADPTYLGNKLLRRSSGAAASFPVGIGNVEIAWVAGRYANTTSVDERFKRAAAIMLKNLWRSQQDATGTVDEFDSPQSIFPAFSVPNAVRDMFPGEIQDPTPLGPG
jgi:hypothetical protein